MSTLTVPWPHDGAQQLQVEIDQDLPAYGPLEQRIRSAASVAKSHAGLRWMLEATVGESWTVVVGKTVAGVTTVELRKRLA